MADERPETGSTQGSFIVMGVLTISIGLVITTALYLLVDQRIVFKNLADTITRSGSAKGVISIMMATFLLLTIMITIFGFRAILPNLMADKERQDNATKMLRERVIPISATIFFILFLYQFIMGGRDVSASQEVWDKMNLILIISVLVAIVQLVRVFMKENGLLKILMYSVIGAGGVLGLVALLSQ
jgi:hypothetical protein